MAMLSSFQFCLLRASRSKPRHFSDQRVFTPAAGADRLRSACEPISDKIIMRVEFLGVPRERAGVSVLELQADTLGQLFAALARRFPAFAELVSDDRLRPSMVANLNGDRFVSDPGIALNSDDCVLILSADAGG
jgi:molybdopterin converting factor small subunit